MIYIAHRGNLTGPNPEFENNPNYLMAAVDAGFDVEIDVWRVNSETYLGHDMPNWRVSDDYLDNNKFWCHAKNTEALQFLLDRGVHCFYHDTDDHTLTSRGYVWSYPGVTMCQRSIHVIPEKTLPSFPFLRGVKELVPLFEDLTGVCSDYVQIIKNHLNPTV